MKYLILMQVDPDVLAGLSEAQMSAIGDGHEKFMAAITETGEFLSTNALGDASQSSVVRSRGGVPEVVDGPFAESKEFMGGYYLVDVESKERAVELARQIPDAKFGGLAIEVRPIMFEAGFDM